MEQQQSNQTEVQWTEHEKRLEAKHQVGIRLVKNTKVNGDTSSIKLDSDKLQVIHKLSALLASDYFNIEYVTELYWAVEQTARVRRAEQLGMVHPVPGIG